MAYNFAQYHDAMQGYAAYQRSTLPYHAPHAHRNMIEKSLKSAVPSSTPHAPRNLLNQLGQAVPQKRHLKLHKFLDNNAFKSASAPNLLLSNDEKHSNVVGKGNIYQTQQAATSLANPSKPLVAEAWTTDDVVAKKVIKVKPYRRSTGRKAPVGVPLLDLHKLNEPDSQMAPIELLPATPDSSHSGVSWGPVSKVRAATTDNKDLTTVEDTEEVQVQLDDSLTKELSSPIQVAIESVNDSDINSKDMHNSQDIVKALETPKAPFDSVVMEKIEAQMEDDLMGQHVVTTPSQTKPYTQAGDQLKTKITNQHLKPTSLHYYTGISRDNIGSLNKRIKFSVRLLTRNGRDIHREMCGFYFVSDNSLTIYELRQFGKKLTAIPLIQRGIYQHLKGACKGQEYEVNSIRKETVLQFETAMQPSLPVSLLQHRLLSFKITAVDEESKKQLLVDGIKDLVERRRMEQYLSQPLPDQGKDAHMLCTIQTLMRERLTGRAAKTLLGLGRQLAKSSDKDDVTSLQLQLALRQFHISITPEDLQRFWSLVDPEGVGRVEHLTCIQGLVGEMKEGRKHLLHQLFRKLDVLKSGSVTMANLKTYFNPRLHPDVLAGRKSCDEVCFVLFNSLEPSHSTAKYNQQAISFAEFEDYFEGVSIDTQSDVDFTKIVKDCWGL